MVFSAHGVAPTVRAEAAGLKLATTDATFPLVTKVHKEAVLCARDGYGILLIGHESHEEVIGTMPLKQACYSRGELANPYVITSPAIPSQGRRLQRIHVSLCP
ncbi:hypothetical protein GCM10010245_89970 [Streptomyces spectabilis]|uniref:4-hydroxy-3-methylbut-2-enyl diphosphate reductase IspH n=1 Tax=Streptomyces spectabilis TaxID=68270 RepID=A0A7W8B4S0_STRST|nr:4-hydroxy-3-methylbut-2-enyl diphosphate reductase IspH [Streptomyces spectabilis]GGV56924.1 hypothetical protein GCM10010245_89970 [Streptomyces spectabilis]